MWHFLAQAALAPLFLVFLFLLTPRYTKLIGRVRMVLFAGWARGKFADGRVRLWAPGTGGNRDDSVSPLCQTTTYDSERR